MTYLDKTELFCFRLSLTTLMNKELGPWDSTELTESNWVLLFLKESLLWEIYIGTYNLIMFRFGLYCSSKAKSCFAETS